MAVFSAIGTRTDISIFSGISASPLNGQAAELWDTDPEEYKKHVLARHRDIEAGE